VAAAAAFIESVVCCSASATVGAVELYAAGIAAGATGAVVNAVGLNCAA
jgi:hypothetical protein